MEAGNTHRLLHVCRLCLVPKEAVVDLFDVGGGANHCWADVINYVLDVKVMQSENLPSKGCMACIGRVRFAVPFKNMCLLSNSQMRGIPSEEADFTITNDVCRASEKSVKIKSEIENVKIKSENENVKIKSENENVKIKSENYEVSSNPSMSIKIEENVCRLCLKADYSTLELFKNAPTQDVILNDILSFSLGIKACEGDGFPQSICSMCAGKLYVLNNFKKQFLDSSKILFFPLIPKEEVMEDDAEAASVLDTPENNSMSSSCNILTCINPPVADINLQLCLKCNKVNCNTNHDQVGDAQLTAERTIDGDDSTTFRQPSVTLGVKLDLKNTDIAVKTLPDEETPSSQLTGNPKCRSRASYRCGLCGRLYGSKSSAIGHAQTHVNAEVVLFKEKVDRIYTCGLCDKVYKTYGSLAAHKRTHGERKFGCASCPRKFHHKKNLKNHVQTHATELAFHCDQCPAKFRTRVSWKAHLKRHAYKTFLCDRCPLRFYGKQKLNRHMLSHSGEQPHSCQICFRRFSLKVNLKYHMRTHSGEKPYTCAHCLRSFSMKCSLGEHTKIHTGVHPYPCKSCGKAFKSVSAMRKHEKIHGKYTTKGIEQL